MPNRNITRDWDWLYDYDRRDYDQNDSEYGFYDPYLYNRTDPRGERKDRQVRGRYTGYGPRNYRRSDAAILEDVNDRLTQHSWIDASDVNVGVDDGVVTLTGSVATRSDKRLAEDIADDVSGVWDVHNQLQLRNRQPGGR